jgi:rod shape determining protein RodA
MRMSRAPARIGDPWLATAAFLLTLFGAIVMVSATAAFSLREGRPALALAQRHALWSSLGILAALSVSRLNARRWMDLGWLAYGLGLAALAAVPIAGAMRLGATRWLTIFGFSVQPAEVMKLVTIWLMSRVVAGSSAPLSARAVGSSLLLAALPALLVFLQPDLGSASVFGAIWLGMAWVAGLSRRQLGGLAAVGAALLPLGWHLLKDYQRQRLLVFLNPHADPLGAGYTVIQSVIAIGSGQWWGRGWLAGTQNQLSFLPERHSDFIFSVIGEEWGFAGCLVVIGLFGGLLTRLLRVARRLAHPQGRVFVSGVVAWLAYQAVVNMGMGMGVVPVVGVPLPFMSFGGSAMVAGWLALGLVQSLIRSD